MPPAVESPQQDRAVIIAADHHRRAARVTDCDSLDHATVAGEWCHLRPPLTATGTPSTVPAATAMSASVRCPGAGHGHAVDVTDSNGPNRACVGGERFLPGHWRAMPITVRVGQRVWLPPSDPGRSHSPAYA